MPNALKNLKIGEVSFCRKGMNQHARVALFKSATALTTPKAIAKATFDEALQANMTADAVNSAFYESFDGLWERNDAFRTALTDELSEGGDGTEASAAYVASVKALVDEAVAEARQAGATAADVSKVDQAFNAAVAKWLETKKEQTTMKITNRAELQAAVSKFAIATSTVADVQAIHKAAEELGADDLLPADGPLAKAKPSPELAKAQREIAVLKLTPESKAHFDTLDEAGQTAFLGKSAADQAADIEKVKGDNPVVYTTSDGIDIRKSDGAAALALAKRGDENAKELAKLRGELGSTNIEKVAGEKYPNVAKPVAVDMLKSVETVGKDTEAGKALLSTLDTMNKAGGRLMKSIGSSEGSDAEPGDLKKAQTDYDAEVSKIVARDKCDRAAAMSKARVEHPDLWKAAFPDTAEAVEAHEVDQAVGG